MLLPLLDLADEAEEEDLAILVLAIFSAILCAIGQSLEVGKKMQKSLLCRHCIGAWGAAVTA